MKPRDFAGAVNRAKTVWVWVAYAPGFGTYVECAKVAAKALVTQAKDDGVDEIEAEVEDGELFIGEELTTEAETEPEGRRDEEK